MSLELKEGRFAAIGEPGTGVLGAIETEFISLLGGPSTGRSLSTLEGILARAITRGWLRSLGGVLKGRYELTLPIGQPAHTESEERASERRMFFQRMNELDSRFEDLLKSSIKKATLPLEDRIEALEAQVRALISVSQQKTDVAAEAAVERPKIGRPRKTVTETGDKW
jgi:hypothetical protein